MQTEVKEEEKRNVEREKSKQKRKIERVQEAGERKKGSRQEETKKGKTGKGREERRAFRYALIAFSLSSRRMSREKQENKIACHRTCVVLASSCFPSLALSINYK
mmetsp:Transcript_21546/g.42786  ORF Transcript_21546/g.42786 Transcript_21546/m.42786 type:complete len:105 (+) Transcript_21546:1650-1964(+)